MTTPDDLPKPWSDEDRLAALNLYFKIPANKVSKNNEVIRKVAAQMNRRPNTLALKIKDFARLDPLGQPNTFSDPARRDRELWDKFHTHPQEYAVESELALHNLFVTDSNVDVEIDAGEKLRLSSCDFSSSSANTESLSTVRTRLGQQFFRQTVLNAYEMKCCISGVNVPRLLIASHIKPWGQFPEHRLDPANGLCLSSLHDAAFDSGLLTLDGEFRVVLSPRLAAFFPNPALELNFLQHEGRRIFMPSRFAPSSEFLAFHRHSIFQSRTKE